jgi:hypothetical protein
LHGQVVEVAPIEAQAWTRHLIPLPQELAIKRKVVLRPSALGLQLDAGSGDIGRQATAELRALLRHSARAEPQGESFQILIGLIDGEQVGRHLSTEEKQRLQSLPNRDQAYLIKPAGSNRLVLAATHPRGLSYAVRTLYQLLEPKLSEQEVSIPLAEVVDWPDLEERGVWNFPKPQEWVPWMVSLKLNFGKMAETKINPIERGKPGSVALNMELYESARRQAFEYQPFLMHLNFLHIYGLFQAYPELAGRGDSALTGRYFAHKRGNQHRAPNAADPLFPRLLAEWLGDFARQGITEVSCWLSERPGGDEGPETTAIGQEVMETRALLAAFNEVKKEYPDFTIRMFLSTVPAGRYYRAIAEMPAAMKIERACATKIERVVRLPRDLFRNPMLDAYAAEGRWIASYDVPLTANARVDTPEFMVPESSAHRVRDYVRQLIDRKFRGAYGMMAWADNTKATCGFNVHALAEYGWNIDGRSEKEFAIAWATREGYNQPEKVGAWAELMGPIEFDVYDSDFPIAYSWGKFIKMVKQRDRPYLGEGVFRYYSSAEDFDRKIATADRALGIAETFSNNYLANETRVVQSYVKLSKSLYQVAEQVATEDFRDQASQDKLRLALGRLAEAGEGNTAAIKRWRTALGPEPWHRRVHDAIKGTEDTVDEITDFVSGRYFY